MVNPTKSDADAGFFLIDVIIALAILGLFIPIVLQGISSARYAEVSLNNRLTALADGSEGLLMALAQAGVTAEKSTRVYHHKGGGRVDVLHLQRTGDAGERTVYLAKTRVTWPIGTTVRSLDISSSRMKP